VQASRDLTIHAGRAGADIPCILPSSRLPFAIALVTTATSFFLLGVFHAQTTTGVERADYDARLEAIRAEVRRSIGRSAKSIDNTVGTSGAAPGVDGALASHERARLVQQLKLELQGEMGLLPVQIVRARRSSFVELHTEDNFGRTSYGTAGYLGGGYFITVKHAVVPLSHEEGGPRRIVSMRVTYPGGAADARLVDAGDADVEVHHGDWAIIRTRALDLPALRPNTMFGYEFAEPIFRLGNDYSKGIIVSTGYVGQQMANGLVSCLTDGHPGVSGGGVLDRHGDLVGIPIGRMQGDYRFSFILPVRAQMFRKIPWLASQVDGVRVAAAR
jgi:hypothetical protein